MKRRPLAVAVVAGQRCWLPPCRAGARATSLWRAFGRPLPQALLRLGHPTARRCSLPQAVAWKGPLLCLLADVALQRAGQHLWRW